MDKNKNKHYQNEKGFQLNDFLKTYTGRQYLIGWYTLQVVKYFVRAGKKDGESKEKDLNKGFDYFDELWEIQKQVNKENETDISYNELFEDVMEIISDFDKWNGEIK